MATRSRTRRRPRGVHVVDVPRSALVSEVTEAAKAAGLSLDEFKHRGRSGTLHEERLRDLWLMTRSLFDDA
jgi:hypothetical protein